MNRTFGNLPTPPRFRPLRIFLALCALIGLGWLVFQAYRLSITIVHRSQIPAITLDRVRTSDQIIPVAIIGSGPAGLSAALYSARFNIHTVVFEGPTPGGQLTGTSDVENWPGIGRDRGTRLIDRLRNQAGQFGVLYSSSAIDSVDTTQWPFMLTTDNGAKVHALAIILATGATPKRLNVPGEDTYFGRGVTTCATCDAPFYGDKTVVVVGGGDAAVEEALQLASYAKEITVLVRGDHMRASHAMQERLKAYPHIKVRYHTKITTIHGSDEHVTHVSLAVGPENKPEQMQVDGVFLAVGHTPNSSLVTGAVATDAHGYIQLTHSHKQYTSRPGIFAAGDVSDSVYRQAGVASGDGIRAAIDAAHFLREQGIDDAFLSTCEHQLYNPDAGKSFPALRKIITEEEFTRTVLQAKLPVIVEFSTPACPSCVQLQGNLSAAAVAYTDRLTIVIVDGAQLPSLMKRYDITKAPTVLAFKDGMVVGKSTTLVSRRDVQAFAALYAALAP